MKIPNSTIGHDDKQVDTIPACFTRAILCSGHLIDRPERVSVRFPADKEIEVRESIYKQLQAWQVNSDDLALCGGANGADLLFAELCAEMGTNVYLLVPEPLTKFLPNSVSDGRDTHWEERLEALLRAPNVWLSVMDNQEQLVDRRKSIYELNNQRLLATAQAAVGSAEQLFAILVWDEKSTGDGPGGTAHFAKLLRQAGVHIAPIINPHKL